MLLDSLEYEVLSNVEVWSSRLRNITTYSSMVWTCVQK